MDLTTAPPPDVRPAIAIVSNSHTPYRTHLHRRICAEIPQVVLHSLYTHQTSNSSWTVEKAPETNPVDFGEGESIANQDRLTRQWDEWKRGGRIIRWLVEHRVQLVVVMGYNDLGRVRLLRWCHAHGVACYLFGDSNIFGDRSTGARRWLKRLFLRRLLRWLDGAFVCGSLGRRYFEQYGVDRSRTYFFPYEPDYTLTNNPLPDTVAAVARQFHLLPNRQRIAFSGRLADVKRVDLLMDAFIALADERPNWDLLLIGDGPLRESLAARLPAKYAGRVVWTGFIDDQVKVGALYRWCQVLVLPSDYEPWALVINEAVSAGLAVVSTDVVGAAAELVVDGVNGRLFKPGDLAGLTDCLRDVTTPGVAERMAAAAPAVLQAWRDRADPVAGLRSALRSAGVV